MTVYARGRAARFTKLAVALGIAVVGSVTAGVTAATAYANAVTYTGQGAIADGFGWAIPVVGAHRNRGDPR